MPLAMCASTGGVPQWYMNTPGSFAVKSNEKVSPGLMSLKARFGAMRAAWKSMECGIAPLFVISTCTLWPCRTWITGPGAPPANVHPRELDAGRDLQHDVLAARSSPARRRRRAAAAPPGRACGRRWPGGRGLRVMRRLHLRGRRRRVRLGCRGGFGAAAAAGATAAVVLGVAPRVASTRMRMMANSPDMKIGNCDDERGGRSRRLSHGGGHRELLVVDISCSLDKRRLDLYPFLDMRIMPASAR